MKNLMRVLMTYRKNQLLGVFCVLFSVFSLSAQETIQWMSWEEVQTRSKVEKRKVFVDLYTDWCGWCKKMDKSTFRKPEIVAYINANYYPVKFNAEQRNSVVFKDKVYKFVKSGRRGYHELAVQIAKGNLKFPTLVFMDEQLNVIQPISGFQDARNFEMIITYFAGNYFKTTPWKRYTRNYRPLKDRTDKKAVPSTIVNYGNGS